MSDKLYNVGMYIRLSKESASYSGDESQSIENQQTILSKFISVMPGWVEKRTYIDNGATGGHFNRQGFQDMMVDVRSGDVNLILVHDLSRFGRNYIETGKYLEEELPALGCRFVAITDGIDTETGENDILPFLNAMNDYYLKNISDKIKTVFQAKAKNGHKLTGTTLYGYTRDPNDHNRLVVDEHAASVVKRIFNMRADGFGYTKIVGVLNRDNILPPRLYYSQKNNRVPPSNTSQHWQIHSLPTILRDEHYLGTMVSFKSRRSYRSGKSSKTSKDEWMKTPDTHEAIIDVELWDKVQKVNERLSKTVENRRVPRPSLFSGKIFCSDCKTPMTFYSGKKEILKDGRVTNCGSYACKTHVVTGFAKCSWHRVYENPLKKIVLDNIRRQAESFQLDEAAMLQKLREKLIGVYSADKATLTAEQHGLKQELHSIDLMVDNLYEDKITGAITAEHFSQLAGKTETRRREVEDRLVAIEKTESQAKTKLGDIQKWIRLIRENAIIEAVDRALLEALIDRVEIGESSKENGVKKQDVWIYYKFVGLV